MYYDINSTTIVDEEKLLVIKDGKNGIDGYTPIKGRDYFDGKDGKDGTSIVW
jgi:hypothetical protein